MRDWIQGSTNQITDLVRGSVPRTLLEAIAVPIEELYFQLAIVLPKKYFLALSDDYNDTVALVSAETFGQVTPTGQTTAVGPVSFYGSVGLTVPSGYSDIGMDNGLNYTTTAAGTVLAGDDHVDVPVTCSVAGAAGNLSEGRPFELPSAILGLTRALVGPGGIGGGADQESAEHLKARVPTFWQNQTTGTPTAIVAAAVSVPGVHDAFYRGGVPLPGAWTCYVNDGSGSAGPTLLQSVWDKLHGSGSYAGGASQVDGELLGFVDKSQIELANVTVTVTTHAMSAGDWATLQAQVSAAVAAYMLTLSYDNDLYTDMVQAAVDNLDTSAGVPIITTGVTIDSYTLAGVTYPVPTALIQVINPGRTALLRATPGTVIRAGAINIAHVVI
jgi:uncharacterized phage protein gp47/JayE